MAAVVAAEEWGSTLGLGLELVALGWFVIRLHFIMAKMAAAPRGRHSAKENGERSGGR